MAKTRKYRGSWVIDYRDQNGRRIIKKVESKSDGDDQLADVRQSIKNQSYDPTKAEIPLGDYAKGWLEITRRDQALDSHKL